MKVFVTGIRGFIGTCVEAEFSKAGWAVSGCTSQASKAGDGVIYREATMPLRDQVFDGVDVVVHCSYLFTAGAGALNQTDTLSIATAASERGVPRQVYVSSLSARPDADSEYGKTKYSIECTLRQVSGVVIVRPGTVVGRGGVFGRLLKIVERSPVVPLIDGGSRPIQLIGQDDLARAIVAVGKGSSEPDEYNLFYATQPTFKQLLITLKERMHLRCLFMPVPGRLLLGIAEALERMRIPFPINAENLRGYLIEQSLYQPADSVSLFGRKDRSLAELVDTCLVRTFATRNELMP